MIFGEAIINWYEKNKRDLPWRKSRNPYHIWLSEVILQQTRVEQGLSYYYKFIEKYPSVKDLAAAKESEVLRLWQGLGYYSRARNLHKASRQIVNKFNGKFPSGYESIRSLKGVGDYTAAAIASFAFEKQYPVVDGNVFRLLSRYFGIQTPIDTSVGKKEFTNLAGELMKGFPAVIFNQAIMEFGSGQCRPSNPDCVNCPLNVACYSFKKKSVANFPVKKNTIKTKSRYFNYLVIQHKNSFFIRKRKGKDIWEGLHDFPLIETKKQTSEKVFLNSSEWKKTFVGKKAKLIRVSPVYKHILSHQQIHARFYEISIENKTLNEKPAEWKSVTKNSIKKHALPRLIERYLEERYTSHVTRPTSHV